jgi:hypothetical protein
VTAGNKRPKTGSNGDRLASRFFSWLLPVAALVLCVGAGCSIFYGRPTQDMADTQAAMRAAKEVQADTLAPELYREASDWWLRAKREYKFKNFSLAHDYADKARTLAEQAEFESVRAGGVREEPPDPLAKPPGAAAKFAPYAYPTPTGTPAEVFEQRKQDEAKDQTKAITPAPAPSGAVPAAPLK